MSRPTAYILYLVLICIPLSFLSVGIVVWAEAAFALSVLTTLLLLLLSVVGTGLLAGFIWYQLEKKIWG